MTKTSVVVTASFVIPPFPTGTNSFSPCTRQIQSVVPHQLHPKIKQHQQCPLQIKRRATTRSSSSSLVIQKAAIIDTTELVTDVIATLSLGYGTIPFAEILYNATTREKEIYVPPKTDYRYHKPGGNYNEPIKKNTSSSPTTPFPSSIVYEIASGISRGAWIFGLFYGLVILYYWVLETTSFAADISMTQENEIIAIRSIATHVGLTVWGAMTIQSIKKWWFAQRIQKSKTKQQRRNASRSNLEETTTASTTPRLGRITLLDNFLDIIIATLALLMIIEYLDIPIGSGIQSLFAAGSIGALVFSFASRDLVQQMIAGLAISAWDVFEKGDEVSFGGSKGRVEGVVKRIGFVDTDIQGYDNIIIKIPNSQLLKQRVKNISLITESQVKQILRFKYTDINKLPQILKDIKEELQTNHPKLITDGSKPFMVHLTNYEIDHIQVVVNCHFKIKPETEEYIQNRENMLLAIANVVVKKNNMEFAVPVINYKSSFDDDKTEGDDDEEGKGGQTDFIFSKSESTI